LSITRQDVFQWLDHWQSLINSGDYEAARPLFAGHVVAFGSLTSSMSGLAELESRQWRQVWHRIRDFRFDKETATMFPQSATNIAVVCCLWHSLGKTQSSWYERRGRVTLVLEWLDGGLRCVHSHFSMEPGIPPVADAG
jgi:ketosteroid isomerase-like protein